MDTEYKIIEIFPSIDGEGKRTGELTTFIRLSGCNLRCRYCDTPYGQSGTEGEIMTLEEILSKVNSIGFHNITVTGGEPLFNLEIDKLLHELSIRGYDVNVETNGSFDVTKFFTDDYKNVWFTVDYKSNYSGMKKMMLMSNYENLRSQDVIKFVCADREDLLDTIEIIEHLNYERPYIYYSPVYGVLNPEEIVKFMKENHLQDKVRVQVQLHKIIWGADARGV